MGYGCQEIPLNEPEMKFLSLFLSHQLPIFKECFYAFGPQLNTILSSSEIIYKLRLQT